MKLRERFERDAASLVEVWAATRLRAATVVAKSASARPGSPETPFAADLVPRTSGWEAMRMTTGGAAAASRLDDVGFVPAITSRTLNAAQRPALDAYEALGRAARRSPA
jgi:hypothetical protein